MRKLQCKRGFTIVELLVGLAIIGILCLAAIPVFMGVNKKTKKDGVLHALLEIGKQQHALSFGGTCVTAKGKENIRLAFPAVAPLLPSGGKYDLGTDSGPAYFQWIAYAVPFDPDSGLKTYCVDSEMNKRACPEWDPEGSTDCSACSEEW